MALSAAAFPSFSVANSEQRSRAEALAIADIYTVLQRASGSSNLDTLALSSPVKNQPYSGVVEVVGGSPPYRFQISARTALNRWEIDPVSGLIQGVPTISVADQIVVTVVDSLGDKISKRFVLAVLSGGVGGGVWPVSLRPASFGEIPLTVASTSVGRRAPHTLPQSGQCKVKPNNSYTKVIRITQDLAPHGQYTCSSPDTHYVLMTDLTSDTWCIKIAADRILIDLNGHTLTYLNRNLRPSSDVLIEAAGIFASGYDLSLTNIEIINGRIQTGEGAIVGDLPPNWGFYGFGANPFRTEAISGTPKFQLRGLYLKWNSYSSSGVAGHNTSYEFGIIENCTFEDCGALVASRELPVWGTDKQKWGIVRYCRFISMRQGAIGAAINAYGNEIWVDSWVTNATGISISGIGQNIYGNNIYITGVHPQAIFISGSKDAHIRDNWLEAMYTRAGNQVPSRSNDLDDAENYAVGVTFRFGSDSGLQIEENTALIHAKSETVQSPTSLKFHNSTARGFWYAKQSNSVNSNNLVQKNCFAVIAADDQVHCWGLAMGGPATGLKIIGNRFVTNRNLFYIADSYNYYQGLSGDPVISGNFFELLPGRANTTTLTNGAGSSLRVSLASIAIQDAEVTISFATQGGASYPRGTTIVVEGVTGASGVNGSYRVLRCTSVVGGMTSITYQSSVSGQPQLSNAKVTLPVLVGARFSGNTWIGGVWRGSKLPGQDMLSASHGTSGSEPITYAGLNDGCTIEFANEPSGLE